MKKLIASLIAGFMVTAGLVFATSMAPAQAACQPYPGTVATKTVVKSPKKVKKGKAVAIKVRVKTLGDSWGKANGKLKVKIIKKGGSVKIKTKKTILGGYVKFTSPKLKKKGKYTIKVKYKPESCTVYKKSVGKKVIRVK